MNTAELKKQFNKHFIALLSLAIAIVALSYTTWREEITEKNRNTRMAAFEVLKNLGELQIIINYSIYEPENPMGNPLLAWGHIAIISDMGAILPAPIPDTTQKLVNVWANNWQKLKTDEKAQDRISDEVDMCRKSVLEVIKSLH